MTTNRSVTNELDANHQIAKKIGTIFTLILFAFGIWFATYLLIWAIDKRGLESNAIKDSDITMELRERQLTCLGKNIYHEAGGEPFEGKVAVAQVTLNRAKAAGFPGDICKVIYQKNQMYEKVICQFSWVCESAGGAKPTNNKAYNESMSVAKKVLLEGFRLPGLTEALYFHGDYINPGWKREKVAHIGHHIFYK